MLQFSALNDENLYEWRKKLLPILIKVIFLTSWLIGLPFALLAVMQGNAGVNAVALCWTLYMFVRRKGPYVVSVTNLLLMLYALAVATLLIQGLTALMYFLALSLVAVVFVSAPAAFVTIAVTSATVFLCGYFFDIDPGGIRQPAQGLLLWAIIVVYFLIVSIVLVFICNFMLRGMSRALTQQKEVSKKFEHMATHDDLTGLPNRRLFVQTLTEQLEASLLGKPPALALVLVDVSHVKSVVSAHGYAVADKLLQSIAQHMVQMVGERGWVSCLGDHEFAVALTDPAVYTVLQNRDTHLLQRLDQVFEIEQKQLFVKSYAGVALFPQDGQDAAALIKCAGIALGHATERKEDHMVFFEQAMVEQFARALEIENDLRDALACNQLQLYFQPRVQAKTRRCHSAEVLVRWKHPEKGMISPALFIPVAEKSGFINAIGAWVLRTAMEQLLQWRESYPDLRLSVNLSTREFQDPGLLDRLESVTQKTPKHSLEIEITESAVIDDVQQGRTILRWMRANALQVALDDFGTGASCLAYLKELPLDVLKIDKTFVDHIIENTQSRAIVRSIIDLASNLSFVTVAEGVETRAQLELLTSYGVDEIQGYYFAKPMPAEAFEQWLKKAHTEGLG